MLSFYDCSTLYNDTRTVPGHVLRPYRLPYILPISQINNYRLTIYNIVYIGVGYNNPFFSFMVQSVFPFRFFLSLLFLLDTLHYHCNKCITG
nr:MAG TPA: hypothetical protein [Bacteriophage sp.]